MTAVSDKRKARVATALKIFAVFAWVTGVMLLALCAEMIYKYLILDPGEPTPELLKIIAIAHGWCYMGFLMSVVNLGTKARWAPTKWLVTALGGVVPFLSFWVERQRSKEIKETILNQPTVPTEPAS